MDLILSEPNIRQTAVKFVQRMFKHRGYQKISQCKFDTDQEMNLGPHISFITATSADGEHVLAVFSQVCHDPYQAMNMSMDESESYEQALEREDDDDEEDAEAETDTADATADVDEDEEEIDDEDQEMSHESHRLDHRLSDCESTWASRHTETKKQLKESKSSNVEFVQALIDYADTNNISIIVLITDGVTPPGQKTIHHAKQKITVFKYHETMIPSLLQHKLQPIDLKKLSHDERENYIAENKDYQRELVPRSTDDALMKYMGFSHGDIIKCIMYDKQAGLIEEYCLVQADLCAI